jgi:iron complex transport system ATP-binding protein
VSLDVADVSVTLGSVEVLDRASLSATEGEFLGLVGPNGAGKTTLLRTINGVLTPDSGRVRIDGRAGRDLGARERSRLVATVPQDTGVGFDLTVEDLVEMGRTPYRRRFGLGLTEEDRDAVADALERTTMTDLRERPVGAVSGGERQRAYVARALAQDAPLLVCDEPTASLDVNHQVNVLSLLAGLADEGRTVVAAIHDLDLAARFCDRLALLSEGSIQAVGAPESVLADAALDDAFGTQTTVVTHPVTGAPTVTAHDGPDSAESVAAEERDAVHVVGSGRACAQVIATLRTAGFGVTAGPLADGDVALETAEALSVETVRTPPLALSNRCRREARELAVEADVVVLADAVLDDDGTVLDVVGDAPTVVVEERPLHERNHGPEGVGRRYERVRSASETTTAAGVVDAVAGRLAETRLSADD